MSGAGLLLVVWGLCACDSAAQTPGSPLPTAGRSETARARAPKEPSPKVLKTICASEFGQGNFARVDVFRDRNGAIAVLALRPDINRFTHAPHTYYGPDGVSLLVVPERTATPEQLKSDPVLQKRDQLLRDLEASGSRFCSKYR